MSVVLSVEETGPSERQLKIEVPLATVEAETERIVGEFRRQAKLPGFRKGKVPPAVVRRRFAADIEQEVLERLVPRYWRQAEAEQQLRPLLPPSVGEVKREKGEPLVFTATVEVRPDFPLADLENFTLPELSVAVTAEEVDRTVEDLRRSLAPWVEVDRGAAQGDLVEAMLREVGEEPGEAQAVAFEVGDKQVWEELSLEVVGKKSGQSGAFSRAEDDPDGGHRHEYGLEITAVKQRDLPPLDDALAARIGKFETLEALREDIEKRIAAGKRQEAERRREQAVLDQLRERNPAPMPVKVLDREIRHMLTDYAESLGQRGVDPSRAQIDWQELGEKVRPQAEARVHARLLLDAVAEKWKLEVPEETFEATLAGLARAQGTSAAQLRRSLDRDGRLGELRAQLRRERALRRLLGEEAAGGAAAEDRAAVQTVAPADEPMAEEE